MRPSDRAGMRMDGSATVAEALLPAVEQLRAAGIRVIIQDSCQGYRGLPAAALPLLRLAFRSLLDNAREAVAARPNGEVRVAATMAEGLMRIRFCDTGGGIPRGEFRQIFEPFYTTKPGHLGLGLPLCQAIVSALGGTVFVASTGENGSEVVVELPCLCRRPHGRLSGRSRPQGEAARA